MINYGSINNPYTEKVGTIKPWPEATAPAGWLICDGSAISRTTYKALFDVIGETYGAGDGTTTFNIPNGEIPVGTNIKAIGNGITLGFTSGTNGGVYATSNGTLGAYNGFYGKNVGYTQTGLTAINSKTLGLTTEGDKSGIIADLTSGTAPTITIIKY